MLPAGGMGIRGCYLYMGGCWEALPRWALSPPRRRRTGEATSRSARDNLRRGRL